MRKEKTIISLEIPTDLKQKLSQEAEEKEMSVSQLIRFFIKEHYKGRGA